MKRFTAILVLLSAAFFLRAQTTVKVNVPELVAVDEQFNLTFIIEGEHAPSEFSWSAGDDFQVVWGPQKGTSTSVSIVNGKSTRSSQSTYTYVLMPKRTGTFQLQPAVAKVKGEEIVSRRVSVQVVSNQSSHSQGGQGSSSSSRSSQSGEAPGSAASAGTIDGEDLFMRLTLSKTNVVVGETLTATLKLYQRVNIAGFEDAKFPSFNGFWSQEVQAPTNIEFHRESVGDVIYNTAVLRSWTIVPQQAGDITVEPAELVCLVNVRTPRSSGSIFDSFFQDDYKTIRKRVATRGYTVHVSKVPSGAPASFCGGVGNFRMNASLSRDSLRTHDAASLKVTVSGTGNLSLIEAPKIQFPPDFEVYDVKVSDASGSKTFEYPFIPRSRGDFVIGPVEFTYFDVASRKYVTLTSGEMPLRVSGGPDAPAAQQGATQAGLQTVRKDVRDLGSDIRYISTALPRFRKAGTWLVGSWLFLAAAALLTLAAAFVYILARNARKRRADVAGSKSRGATKMARKRLSRAGEFLSGDLYTAFYEELHKTLAGFISDKMNMNASEMSKENIASRLSGCGVPDASVSEFISLMDACEYARYAPSEGHDAMKAHYDTAVSVISTIDDVMRKNSGKSIAGTVVLLALVISGAAAPSSYAQSPDSLWTAGTEAYAAGRWDDAAAAWTAIAESDLESAQLYYNIGNACFKAGNVSGAILNYERALRVDPGYGDASFNLEFAQSMVQDRIEVVPEFVLKTWMRRLCWSAGSDAWAVLFLVFFAALLSMLLLFLLSRSARARKAGFFAGIAALVLAVFCLSSSLWQRSEGLRRDGAVVTVPVSAVKSAPGSDSSRDLFILHEGTEAKVLETVGDWRNIELSDGRRGWIKSSDIELI